MDGFGHAPRGSGSAPRSRPDPRCRPLASSAGSEGEDSASRHSGVASLVSDLPTKSELTALFLGLERSIKEISAVRTDLAQVLERVEESEQRLERHADAIRSLQTATRNLAISHKMALYKIEDQENRNR